MGYCAQRHHIFLPSSFLSSTLLSAFNLHPYLVTLAQSIENILPMSLLAQIEYPAALRPTCLQIIQHITHMIQHNGLANSYENSLAAYRDDIQRPTWFTFQHSDASLLLLRHCIQPSKQTQLLWDVPSPTH